MTTALGGGEGVSVTPRPLLTPGKDPVPIVQETGWAPGPVWTGAENLTPTGIRSPDRPARSHRYLVTYKKWDWFSAFYKSSFQDKSYMENNEFGGDHEFLPNTMFMIWLTVRIARTSTSETKALQEDSQKSDRSRYVCRRTWYSYLQLKRRR